MQPPVHDNIGFESMLGPLDLLIIQPTPFCNLNCDYCYLPFRQSRNYIKPTTVVKIFERVFASTLVQGYFTVVWHSGEPMVLPVGFYADIFRRIEGLNNLGIGIHHSFQTNGTLITPEWCEFIMSSGLRIGVSIDGPAFLHDSHRKTRGGRGTHSSTLRGIGLLQKHEIPFHVISVLTRESLAFPREIFEFFRQNSIYRIGFNVEEIEGVHSISSLSDKRAYEEYVSFMTRFYDLVQASTEPFAIREFDSVLHSIMLGERNCLPHQLSPMAIISVDWEGNFSTFSPELLGVKSKQFDSFTFGSVFEDTFEGATVGERFQKVRSEIMKGVAKCASRCAYFQFCGGGAPVNKLFENGSFDSTETLFCRLSVQAVVDVVVSRLESQLARPAVGCGLKRQTSAGETASRAASKP
jgi:uncharacterized protein